MKAEELHSRLRAGRYAALDVGTNSVSLLVADVDTRGRLSPLAEEFRITRLGERATPGGRLRLVAMERTLNAICELAARAREWDPDVTAAVGTGVLRHATNTREFREQMVHRCTVSLEIISGEQEAELAYRANVGDPHLPRPPADRVVLDIGGGSTEIVQGTDAGVFARASYAVGAVNLTERHLRSDPPAAGEIDAARRTLETVLTGVEPLPPDALLLGIGGAVLNVAAVARAGGLIAAQELHGARLSHGVVAELVDLFGTLPLEFRRRVPGLEPERADIILAGAMILHETMARLANPTLTVSANGIRHGLIFAMAERALAYL